MSLLLRRFERVVNKVIGPIEIHPIMNYELMILELHLININCLQVRFPSSERMGIIETAIHDKPLSRKDSKIGLFLPNLREEDKAIFYLKSSFIN